MYLLRKVLWFGLLLASIAWFFMHVPGSSTVTEVRLTHFRLGSLLLDLTNPVVILIAVISAIAAGRWGGIRSAFQVLLRPIGDDVDAGSGENASQGTNLEAGPGTDLKGASRTLAAAARGLVWGSFLLNGASVFAVYWSAGSSTKDGYFRDPARMMDLRTGGLLAILLGALVLLPASERARESLHLRTGRGERICRFFDAIALLGLFACTYVFLLGILFMRYTLLEGASGPSLSPMLTPTLGAVDLQLVCWSIALVACTPWMALAPVWGPDLGLAARRHRPSNDSGEKAKGKVYPSLQAYARLCLATGVLGSLLICVVGLNQISTSGGNADPEAIRSLVGRMLVPLAVGCVVALFGRLATVGFSSTRHSVRQLTPSDPARI